ncbi:6-phosphogluconolactonase [Nitriliruptor alkaliphilus]|uniref:6-phosphogluconolactonase n=1 Tax=Nitriliruptor alkaliphilus TaxID=427918 RepID=UPI000695FD55|nr:6-phosphogluconolactonase [Nitriliruptor alkaliphilus]
MAVRLSMGGTLSVAPTPREASASAAAAAAAAIVAAQAAGRSARVIFASAPSQESMLAALGVDPRIDWARVQSFHMDEYVGLDGDDPRSFGRWLEERLPVAAQAGLHRIRAGVAGEARRYAELLEAAPVDLTCLGIGVNGHLAFNEPGSSFADDHPMRSVSITDTSRAQQVDDGLFERVADVPSVALTLTIPALLSARTIVGTVLGERKAPAVAAAVAGPISERCPASALRTHDHVSVHVDLAAASALPVLAPRCPDA